MKLLKETSRERTERMLAESIEGLDVFSGFLAGGDIRVKAGRSGLHREDTRPCHEAQSAGAVASSSAGEEEEQPWGRLDRCGRMCMLRDANSMILSLLDLCIGDLGEICELVVNCGHELTSEEIERIRRAREELSQILERVGANEA